LGVREDEGVEPPHARLSEAAEDRAARRAGVEQDRRAAVLQQRRVALADVEERDDEVARLRRAGRAEGRDDDEARQRSRNHRGNQPPPPHQTPPKRPSSRGEATPGGPAQRAY